MSASSESSASRQVDSARPGERFSIRPLFVPSVKYQSFGSLYPEIAGFSPGMRVQWDGFAVNPKYNPGSGTVTRVTRSRVHVLWDDPHYWRGGRGKMLPLYHIPDSLTIIGETVPFLVGRATPHEAAAPTEAKC